MAIFASSTFAARPTSYADPDYLIDTWEVEEGLPENSATAMVQAADGFLWFGTFGGLVRFDGVEFDVYGPSNTQGLTSAGVVNLYLDRSHRQWISTYGGLSSRRDGPFKTYSKVDGWDGGLVRTFSERKNGELLITTFEGRLYEFSGERFHELPLPPGIPDRGYAGWVDEDGWWWAIQSGFIGRWDGQRWISMVDVSDKPQVVWGGAAKDGGLWLVRDRVLTKFQAGAEVSRIELPEMPGAVWSIHSDSEGNIWICTYDNGVCRISASGGFRRFGLRTGLGHNGVRFVFEDHECNLWIGTSGGGLSRFRPRRFQGFGVDAGLGELNVKAVSPDGAGGLWIATYGGGLYLKTDRGISRQPLPAEVPPNIQSVYQDRQRRLWVGSYGAGVHLIENGVARAIPSSDSGGNNGIAFFEDSRGRIWMSGGQYIAVFDGESFRTYGNEQSRPLFGVSHFAETSDGAIWASNGNVFRLENDRFVRIIERTKSVSSISLTGDRDGSVWIGMNNRTLLRWRDGQFSEVTSRFGFSARVQGMVEDQSGFYWMATDAGVIRVGREQLHAVADGKSTSLAMQLFDKSDGLPSILFSNGRQPIGGRDERGRIWFATLKGVAMTDPARLRLNQIPPLSIRFKELRYRVRQANADRDGSREDGVPSEQTVMREPLTGKISLPAGSRHIEVRYAALSLASPERVLYEVKLNDDPWEPVGNRRSAIYTDLPPDDYVLQVRASNNDGVWRTTGETVRFSIEPFYWERAWVRIGGMALLVIMVAGLAGWIVHSRGLLRKQGEEHFRQAVESSPSAMIISDPQGIMQLANKQAEAIFGFDRSEMIGKPIEMLLPLRFAATYAKLRKAYLAEPVMRPMGVGRELFALRKDGGEFLVEVGLTPIETSNGILVLTSISDITERRRMERESLIQRNELAHLSRVAMLGELSGSMAHELNQPLTSILSNAQAAQRFLEKEEVDLNEVREILTDIVEQDIRAGEVIRRLRLLLKKGEVQQQSLNLNEVVTEVLKLMRSDLIHHGVSVESDFASDLPSIDGDRVQLQQVALNMVMNACDAMHLVPASLRRLSIVTAKSQDGNVLLRVADAGCGIPQDSLERIFEPFYTTKESGMGLGLAVCRTIITAHRGKLWATNNQEGGATLYCLLPAGRSVP